MSTSDFGLIRRWMASRLSWPSRGSSTNVTDRSGEGAEKISNKWKWKFVGKFSWHFVNWITNKNGPLYDHELYFTHDVKLIAFPKVVLTLKYLNEINRLGF